MSLGLRLQLVQEVLDKFNDKEDTTDNFDLLEELNDVLDDEITPICVPNTYRRIAVREDRLGINVVYYSAELNKFITTINDTQAGPYTLDELRGLISNYKDVVEMGGRYMYIHEDSY